jgi:hypothetical protein
VLAYKNKSLNSHHEYLSVSSGIPKVWNDNCNRPSGCPSACINHDEELHEVFIGRRAGGLDQEDVTAPHTLLQLHINFSIGKPFDLDLAKIHAQVGSNFLEVNTEDGHKHYIHNGGG